MKKISLFGILTFAVGCFAADQGTKDDPLTINTVQELIQFRDAVSDSGAYKGVQLKNGGEGLHFKLTADLDLSSVCGRGVGNWRPIGPFEGSFDGANHKISNLFIDDSLGEIMNAGFFGPVFNNGSDTLYFKNVVFENAYIRSPGTIGTLLSQVVTGNVVLQNNVVELNFESPKEEDAYIHLGGLMGNNVGDWVGVYNNTVKGSIKITSNKQLSVGGIIGSLVGPGTFEGNTNNATILIDVNAYSLVGGVAGEIVADYVFKGNMNKGNISVNSPTETVFVGGLVGVNPSLPSAKNVVGNLNYGKVDVSASYAAVGGLFGFVSGDSNTVLDSCINFGDISYLGSEKQENVQVGGVAGIWEVKVASRMENNGKIVIKNAISPSVGGIVGFVRPGAKSMDLSNSVNSGNIYVNNDDVLKGWISGIVGQTDELENVTLDNCMNKGDILFDGLMDSTSLYIAALVSVAPQTNLVANTSSSEGAIPKNTGTTALKKMEPVSKMLVHQLGDGCAVLEIPGLEHYGKLQVGLYSYNGKRVPVQQTQSGNMIFLEGIPSGHYIIRVKTPFGIKSLRTTL